MRWWCLLAVLVVGCGGDEGETTVDAAVPDVAPPMPDMAIPDMAIPMPERAATTNTTPKRRPIG